MSLDPMLATSAKFSINTFTGDGVKTTWDLNFSGGYIRRDHVKAYSTSLADVNTTQVLSWVGPNQVSITPPVPNGHTLTIYRDTPKDLPVADFLDGAIINETNLDFVAKQSVFVSAEMVDRLNLFANEAHQALINSEQAITFAQATINGDFTLFVRGNAANTWSIAQNFPVGSQVGGVAIATQSYVTSALGSYATSANLSAAVTTAANDATTKANAAQAVAAADATTKVNTETNRARSMEGFLLCMALR
jgi:hypothetical protein